MPKRVLVVDDEPALGAMVNQILSQRGCRVTFLQDSAAVEPAIKNVDFDLVICDLKMPGLDGRQILCLLRKLKPELARRFMLMTGNLADAANHETEFAGVPLLQKPFTVNQLLEAIQGFECGPI